VYTSHDIAYRHVSLSMNKSPSSSSCPTVQDLHLIRRISDDRALGQSTHSTCSEHSMPHLFEKGTVSDRNIRYIQRSVTRPDGKVGKCEAQ
jgi:hypothetical protein